MKMELTVSGHYELSIEEGEAMERVNKVDLENKIIELEEEIKKEINQLFANEFKHLKVKVELK